MINSNGFIQLCDYIYQPDKNCPEVKSILYRHQPLEAYRPGSKIYSGIIYVGTNQQVEKLFTELPTEGKFIVIHRDNDRSFIKAYYDKMPPSVKHIYTVNCQVVAQNVTAIPIGLATTDGNLLKSICQEDVRMANTQIFCRLNTTHLTHERRQVIEKLKHLPALAEVVDFQMDTNNFYKKIQAHKLTLSLQGYGKDCLRTYEAIILGSIPIVTDCIEMRHFEDMPIAFMPLNITAGWCDAQNKEGKTTERCRMSYWQTEIYKKWNEVIMA